MSENTNKNSLDGDTAIRVVAVQLSDLKEDITDLKQGVKASMDKVTDALTELVRVGERQSFINQEYARLAKQLERSDECIVKLETRIDSLEKDQPDNKRIVGWFYKGLFAAATALVVFVLKFVGIM